MGGEMTKEERDAKLQKLIAEQKKNDASNHVSKKKREVSINPRRLDMKDNNRHISDDQYHGWHKDDV